MVYNLSYVVKRIEVIFKLHKQQIHNNFPFRFIRSYFLFYKTFYQLRLTYILFTVHERTKKMVFNVDTVCHS